MGNNHQNEIYFMVSVFPAVSYCMMFAIFAAPQNTKCHWLVGDRGSLMGNGKPLHEPSQPAMQNHGTLYCIPLPCPEFHNLLGSSQAVMVLLNVSFWYQVVLILPLGVAMGWFNMIVFISVLPGYLGPKMTWRFKTSQDGEIYVKYSSN